MKRLLIKVIILLLLISCYIDLDKKIFSYNTKRFYKFADFIGDSKSFLFYNTVDDRDTYLKIDKDKYDIENTADFKYEYY